MTEDQAASPAQDSPAIETSTPTTDENDVVQDTGQEPDHQEPSETDKLKSAFEKRISRQTAALKAANRQREALEQRIAELTRSTTQGAGPQPPRQEDFENTEDYFKAIGKFESEQENARKQTEADKQKAEESRNAKVAEKQQAFEKSEAELRKVYPDYDEATVLVNEAIDLANKNTPEFQAFVNSMLHSDRMAEITYYLGKNPDVLESLFSLDPMGITWKLAQIEGGLSKPEPQVKNVPAPPTPTRGNGKVSKPLHEKNPKELLAWVKS